MGQTVGVKVFALVIPVVGDQLKVGSKLLNEILQLLIVPKSPPASSCTISCQFPLIALPLKRLNDCSGIKLPVKGDAPAVINVAALIEKQVLV